jgi:hypothetical protein
MVLVWWVCTGWEELERPHSVKSFAIDITRSFKEKSFMQNWELGRANVSCKKMWCGSLLTYMMTL